jgi:hypothetical protein
MSPDGSYIGVGIKHKKKVGTREWIFDYYDVCFFDKEGSILFEKRYYKEIKQINFSGDSKYAVVIEIEKEEDKQTELYHTLNVYYYDTTNWQLVNKFEYEGRGNTEISYDGSYLIDLPWNFDYLYYLELSNTSIKWLEEIKQRGYTIRFPSYYSQIYNNKGKKLLEVIGDIKLFKDNTHFVCNVPGEELALYRINGEKLWSKKINGVAEISSDGNLIAVGGYVSDTLKTSKPYVYLFNREGKLLWKKDIGSKYRTIVRISANGEYIAAVENLFIDWEDGPPPRSTNPPTLFIFDKNGNLLWKKSFFSEFSDAFLWPVAVTDSGLVYGLFRLLYLGEREYKEEKKDPHYLDYTYIFLFDTKGNKIWGWKGDFSPWPHPMNQFFSISADGKYISLLAKEPNYESRFLYFFDNASLIEGKK